MRSSILLATALFVACAAARPVVYNSPVGQLEGKVVKASAASAPVANSIPDKGGRGSYENGEEDRWDSENGEEDGESGEEDMENDEEDSENDDEELAMTPSGVANGGQAGAAGAGVQCPIVFDGRVPTDFALADFDADNVLFASDNVLGNALGSELKFSDVLEFPEIAPSKFDGEEFKALEVTINDNSIFNNQTGFRRTGLLFKENSGQAGDPSIVGVKTYHWSVMQDAAKPFNLTHEYLNVFHETADFSGNQFNFLAGLLIAGVPEGAQENDQNAWKILDRSNKQIFSTPILENEWQNFAITMDMDKNTLQVFTSLGDEPLVAASEPVANDNSGGGQFQIGILKKPTDAVDVTKDGFQEANINEGQIYGGIFVEDSADGCVSV